MAVRSRLWTSSRSLTGAGIKDLRESETCRLRMERMVLTANRLDQHFGPGSARMRFNTRTRVCSG
jgi:hypothetical protein